MSVVSTALRKIRTATRLSLFELFLIPIVFCLLGLARLSILVLPFRTYARPLGRQMGREGPATQPSDAQLRRAHRIGRVIRRTAVITPWASLCLAQALVAATLLRVFRTPYCVYCGVKHGEDHELDAPLDAHAWTRTGDYNVTGGQDVSAFTVVMVFARVP